MCYMYYKHLQPLESVELNQCTQSLLSDGRMFAVFVLDTRRSGGKAPNTPPFQRKMGSVQLERHLDVRLENMEMMTVEDKRK